MIKRIIIKNGKKYIVNCPDWGDYGMDLGIGSAGSSGIILTAGFTVNPSTDFAPFTATFSDSTIYTGTGSLTYTLDFGDGSPTTGSDNVTHVYSTGSFIATLSVTESQQNLSSSYNSTIVGMVPLYIYRITTTGDGRIAVDGSNRIIAGSLPVIYTYRTTETGNNVRITEDGKFIYV